MQKRRQKITEIVNREGRITFAHLKESFPDISEMTLRTDLKYLDETGAIIRVHGGAKSIDTVAGTDGYLSQRIVRNQERKLQIAQKAVALMRELCALTPEDVTICDPDLDEVFMHYYAKEGN